jgi:putative transposase
MTLISDLLEVDRGHLAMSCKQTPTSPKKRRGKRPELSDEVVLQRLERIVAGRPSYGYRRAGAVLCRELKAEGLAPVNHKRVYRIMFESGKLLPKHFGFKPKRKHEGQVTTLRSNTRWCSDSFQFRCWDGAKIEVVFVLDTCDREVLSVVAAKGNLTALDVQDALATAFERRFPGHQVPATSIEWLTDNGGIFVADSTQNFAEGLGLIPCQTPAYSPESNGMSESFVKRFKQDYVYLNDLSDSEAVLKSIVSWMRDYNENHPHKALKMKSPSEFRRASLC